MNQTVRFHSSLCSEGFYKQISSFMIHSLIHETFYSKKHVFPQYFLIYAVKRRDKALAVGCRQNERISLTRLYLTLFVVWKRMKICTIYQDIALFAPVITTFKTKNR